MAEYVDKEEYCEKHCRCSNEYCDRQSCPIWKAPAADVAPVVHGRWVVRFDGPYKRRRCYCSHCGKHSGVGGIAQNQEKPYCPNCGAKMDGGEDAEG